MAKTEYINITVQVKITYSKGYKNQALERANEIVVGGGQYGGHSSAEAIKIIDNKPL